MAAGERDACSEPVGLGVEGRQNAEVGDVHEPSLPIWQHTPIECYQSEQDCWFEKSDRDIVEAQAIAFSVPKRDQRQTRNTQSRLDCHQETAAVTKGAITYFEQASNFSKGQHSGQLPAEVGLFCLRKIKPH